MEIRSLTPQTEASLTHNAIPVQFNDFNFKHVLSGTSLTKVIYIPDPEAQKPGASSVETIASTNIEPGQDPVIEADRRGTVVAVVRLGNKDVGT